MNIFTYGSLMIPSIFVSATGRQLVSQRAYLYDYGRFCLQQDTYPGMIAVKGDITEGMVYFDANNSDIQKLDVFEGDYYRRTPVCVFLDDKTVIGAQSYVIKPEYRHILSDRHWDFEVFKDKFQDTFKRKYFGFSAINEK